MSLTSFIGGNHGTTPSLTKRKRRDHQEEKAQAEEEESRQVLMAGTRKLKRATSKKQQYLKTYESRIARGDKSTPTYAQWAVAGGTERGLMKAGIDWKKDKPSARLKRKKP